jgi:hypothetical protein
MSPSPLLRGRSPHILRFPIARDRGLASLSSMTFSA